MKGYSLSQLSDGALTRGLVSSLAQERSATAVVLAHIAEFDTRKLYAPAGYPSMYEYCLGELRLSEDSACKRIRAARSAREFPVVFEALAEGRLHLSAVVLLAPHLTPDNADELLAAARHRTKSQVAQLIAERFPQPDLPTLVQALAGRPDAESDRAPSGERAPAHAESPAPSEPPVQPLENPSAPGRMTSEPRARVTPLAPQRFAIQFTADQETHDLLRRAQDLLGHQVPAGDVAAVFKRALQTLVPRLEKRKNGAATRPRPTTCPHPSDNPRRIPVRVRRAVWKRDGGRCTFVGERGKRCDCRRSLELDHIEPVARGGQSTIANLRLRCRAHNQLEAEKSFGAEFMRHSREEARRVAEELRVERAAAAGRAADEVRRMAANATVGPASRPDPPANAALE